MSKKYPRNHGVGKTVEVKVLLVEDDPSIAASLVEGLQANGFTVTHVSTGAGALAAPAVDVVLLDIGLPDMDGFDVCRQIRNSSMVPIILLTARSEELDRVVGLELGADDYVTKPYSARELVARIRAVLRRNSGELGESDSGVMTVATVRMDIERHQVSVNGIPISLPLKEFELLEFLMRNAGRVLTRGQLIDRVWGSDYVGDTKTLDVHVKRLRAKIENDPANPALIQTVRGLGYKMEL